MQESPHASGVRRRVRRLGCEAETRPRYRRRFRSAPVLAPGRSFGSMLRGLGSRTVLEGRFQNGEPVRSVAVAGPSGPPQAGNVPVGPGSSNGEGEGIPVALLARVKARDELAAREFVERLLPSVMRIVARNLGRFDEPEDLAQEIFLRVFARLEQYRGDLPIEHWVRRIALNLCLDRLRRQKARPELRWSDLDEREQALLTEMPAEATASETERLASRELAAKLLAALPSADAWLLGELEMKGLAIAEVCAATGWNPGVARIRAFRARRRLKALWQKIEKEQR